MIGRMIHDADLPEIVADMRTMVGPDCYNGKHPLDKMTFAENPDTIGQCHQCGGPIVQTFVGWVSGKPVPQLKEDQ